MAMKRFGAILLFAGAVLLSTHILAPASSPPPPRPVTAADLAPIAQTTPVVEQVDAQVERLRERLATPPAYPAPVRDPFTYGTRPDQPRAKAAAPSAAPATIAEKPAIPAPPLPRVIAIATDVVDGALVRTAVLALGEDFQVVKSGETFSKFVVRSVGIDVVELSDPASGSIVTISLQ
jgi:hypothetical protein